MHDTDTGFRLVITSLEDFMSFCAVIRGDDLDKLREMTARLTKSTTALSDAENADASTHT